MQDGAGAGSVDQAIFDYIDLFFTLLFTLDLVLNLYVTGLAAFLKSVFNLIDLVVVLLSWAAFLSPSLANMSVLRLFRVARIIRLARRLKSLITLARSLSGALLPMANTFGVPHPTWLSARRLTPPRASRHLYTHRRPPRCPRRRALHLLPGAAEAAARRRARLRVPAGGCFAGTWLVAVGGGLGSRGADAGLFVLLLLRPLVPLLVCAAGVIMMVSGFYSVLCVMLFGESDPELFGRWTRAVRAARPLRLVCRPCPAPSARSRHAASPQAPPPPPPLFQGARQRGRGAR